MESVWWVFSEIWKKGLVYKGFKVMPYSTGCTTPLSNFEANLDYRDVKDPSCYVSFQLEEDPETAFVAWTTTPWTLPSNLALCVHPEMIYVKIIDKKTKAQYIMLESRLVELYKTADLYEIKDKFAGSTLEGKKYVPLFPYFEWKRKDGAFRVVADTYVTAESGSGIVHMAPAFGEDDFRVCMRVGIIQKGENIPCPVNEDGHFTEEVTDFVGKYVKDADKPICEYLKQRKRLIKKEEYAHNYPFCWRSGTPLLYKAVPSWFVAVERIRDKLVANNNSTYWVPDHVKEKKFHNWLKDARDWTISRSRFWGTPLPIWQSEDGEETVVVGSIKELEDLSGIKVTDLHRESVDHITIPSKQGKGVLRRVEDVFDCWFESGSMPYAQQHYPFENKDKFHNSFPANFIAEGIDQTRGWFYTLLVLSTILFDKPPFQNLVVNGLVLAADGKKMSKSLRNYPDPIHVINDFGADALRLYLIKSPAVRAENLKFQSEGVYEIIKDVFRPWFNAYRFFVEAVARYNKGRNPSDHFKPNLQLSLKCTNIMDRWIQAATNGLIVFVRAEMQAYRLDTVTPRLVRFIDQLTNWYVRLNRKRLKGSEGDQDWLMGLSVYFEVLMVINRAMSPFTPFLTEYMYQNLRKIMEKKEDSIHYLDFPEPQKEALDPRIEDAVGHVQDVITLGRAARDRRTRPIKYPLQSVTVFHKSDVFLQDVLNLKTYILSELNVKEVIITKDENLVIPIARADRNKLGKKLRKDFDKVSAAISGLAADRIKDLIKAGSLDIEGYTINVNEVEITQQFQGDKAKFEPAWNDEVVVILDIQENESLMAEKTAREVVNRIQKLRKKAGIHPNDPIEVFYEISQDADGSLEKAMKNQLAFITSGVTGIGVNLYPMSLHRAPMGKIQVEEAEIEKSKFNILIARRSFAFDDKAFNLKPEDVETVKNYFWTRDYDRFAQQLEKGQVTLLVGETKVTVTLGKEIFLTHAARK
eukprot:TRINITY_DN1393_c0_g1_i1.p1 TRINITY_DN1393_c0_g1~~TRINITY_DN1393_c0_g1_i1.p1  ORF type:complete len:1148 (-),score=414.33 TRINITY_DN1393_c0_g1_i1:20-2956(-)